MSCRIGLLICLLCSGLIGNVRAASPPPAAIVCDAAAVAARKTGGQGGAAICLSADRQAAADRRLRRSSSRRIIDRDQHEESSIGIRQIARQRDGQAVGGGQVFGAAAVSVEDDSTRRPNRAVGRRRRSDRHALRGVSSGRTFRACDSICTATCCRTQRRRWRCPC